MRYERVEREEHGCESMSDAGSHRLLDVWKHQALSESQVHVGWCERTPSSMLDNKAEVGHP